MDNVAIPIPPNLNVNVDKPIQLRFGVGPNDDNTMVVLAFSVDVKQAMFTPSEARRLSGMLRRVASGCAPEKRQPAAPPVRDTRYMEKETEDG